MVDIVTMRVLARGRVQGVFFRSFAHKQAKALGIAGFARNLSDGNTVEVLAQGPEKQVLEFVEKIKQGPPNALVESLHMERLENTPVYTGFGVK